MKFNANFPPTYFAKKKKSRALPLRRSDSHIVQLVSALFLAWFICLVRGVCSNTHVLSLQSLANDGRWSIKLRYHFCLTRSLGARCYETKEYLNISIRGHDIKPWNNYNISSNCQKTHFKYRSILIEDIKKHVKSDRFWLHGLPGQTVLLEFFYHGNAKPHRRQTVFTGLAERSL